MTNGRQDPFAPRAPGERQDPFAPVARLDPFTPIEPVTEEFERGVFARFARGVGGAFNRTGAAIVGLPGLLIPGRDPFERESEQIRAEGREFFGDPEGTAGRVGQFTGTVLAEGATTLAGGAGLLRGAARLPGAIGRGAQTLQRASQTGGAIQRGLAGGAAFVPVDIALGAQVARLEGREDPFRAGLTEAAIGLGAGVGLEVGTEVVRGAFRFFRGTRQGPAPATDVQRRALAQSRQVRQAIDDTNQLEIFPEGPGAPQQVNAEEFVNVDKLNLEQAAEQRFRGEVDRTVQQQPGLRDRTVPVATTLAAAQKLGVRDILRAKEMGGPELVASQNILKQNSEELARVSQELTNDLLPIPERARLQRQLDGIMQENDLILGRLIVARSEPGRRLNILRQIATAQGGFDETFWLVRAKQLAGDSEWDKIGIQVTAEIQDAIAERSITKLAEILGRLERATLGEASITLWKASLLNNPKTHLVNITSTTAFQVLEAAKERPAAVFDWLLGLSTGERTTFLPRVGALPRILGRGLRRGTREAGRVLRGEISAQDIARLDLRPRDLRIRRFTDPSVLEAARQGRVPSLGAITEAAANVIFRGLGAEDAFLKGFAFERSMSRQAEVLARRAHPKLRGNALEKEIEALIEAPTNAMQAQGWLDAATETFQDPTKLGTALSALVREMGPLAEFVVPFRRTPGAIATRVLEYSGLLGIPKAARALYRTKAARNQLTQVVQGSAAAQALTETARQAQREAAVQLGRATTGGGLLALGYWLSQQGLATGSAPQFGTAERNVYDAAGIQGNSVIIKLPGETAARWHNVARLAPGGNIIALGAELHRLANDPDAGSTIDRILAGPAAAIKTVSDQPFVTGLRTIADLFRDPVQASKRFSRQLVGSFVPGGALTGAIARTIDPVIRETEDIYSAFLARVPFLSRKLPARINVFGEVIERTPGVVANLIDPTSPRIPTDDPIIAEMARVRAGVPRLQRGDQEDIETFNQRQFIFGQISRQAAELAIQSEIYQNADSLRLQPGFTSDNFRREWIDIFVDRARALARAAQQGR